MKDINSRKYFSSILEVLDRMGTTMSTIYYMSRGFIIKPKLTKKFTHNPIVLGGCGRSGTTLLLSILSSHQDIHALPKETGIFCSIETPKLTLNLRFNLNYFFGAYFYKIKPSANRWCEKTPTNIANIDRILKLFKNEVKIIHLVRDGRDVILSKHPTKKDEFWVTPERWVQDVNLGLEFIDHKNVLTIRYEDLILNYRKTIETICIFLDLELNENLLNWHKYATVRENRAIEGKVTPIFTGSIGKWKKTKSKSRIKKLLDDPKAIELLKRFRYID